MPISRAMFESTDSEDINSKILDFLNRNKEQAFAAIEIADLMMLSVNNEFLYALYRLTRKGVVTGKLFSGVVYYAI